MPEISEQEYREFLAWKKQTAVRELPIDTIPADILKVLDEAGIRRDQFAYKQIKRGETLSFQNLSILTHGVVQLSTRFFNTDTVIYYMNGYANRQAYGDRTGTLPFLGVNRELLRTAGCDMTTYHTTVSAVSQTDISLLQIRGDLSALHPLLLIDAIGQIYVNNMVFSLTMAQNQKLYCTVLEILTEMDRTKDNYFSPNLKDLSSQNIVLKSSVDVSRSISTLVEQKFLTEVEKPSSSRQKRYRIEKSREELLAFLGISEKELELLKYSIHPLL